MQLKVSASLCTYILGQQCHTEILQQLLQNWLNISCFYDITSRGIANIEATKAATSVKYSGVKVEQVTWSFQ